MTYERPDLDGLRITALDEPGAVWLMFGGRRHRIASSEVYDALFSEVVGLVEHPGAQDITLGPDLAEGTCLIRARHSLAIFLLTPHGDGLVRQRFPSWESFVDFGFDADKVQDVPPLLLDAVAPGADITSASDRAARSSTT